MNEATNWHYFQGIFDQNITFTRLIKFKAYEAYILVKYPAVSGYFDGQKPGSLFIHFITQMRTSLSRVWQWLKFNWLRLTQETSLFLLNYIS